jgi:hypothetical protein
MAQKLRWSFRKPPSVINKGIILRRSIFWVALLLFPPQWAIIGSRPLLLWQTNLAWQASSLRVCTSWDTLRGGHGGMSNPELRLQK